MFMNLSWGWNDGILVLHGRIKRIVSISYFFKLDYAVKS